MAFGSSRMMRKGSTMSRTLCLTGITWAALWLPASVSPAEAQTNSLFGSAGPLSQTGTTAQRSGLTTGRTSGSAFGQGIGGFGTPANSLGTSLGNVQQFGQLSNTIGQGFVGRSDNAGRFVGQQQAGQQSTQTRRSFRGVGTTGQPGANSPFGNNRFGQSGGAFGGSSQQTILRPVHRIAFRYPQRATTAINTTLQMRFARLAARQPQFRGISVILQGDGEAVLRGTVFSAEDKRLAAHLVRLEPGVRRIRNEITVHSDTASHPGNASP